MELDKKDTIEGPYDVRVTVARWEKGVGRAPTISKVVRCTTTQEVFDIVIAAIRKQVEVSDGH